MKSILEGRPPWLARWKSRRSSGYLWQKGWAERNGGNITINITELSMTKSVKCLLSGL